MKVIDFEQVKAAAENMNPTTWLGWVDYSLRHKSDFQMPPKPRLSQSDGDYYNIMPALYEKDNLASVKMIGRHSIKRDEKRSVMMSDILLYEVEFLCQLSLTKYHNLMLCHHRETLCLLYDLSHGRVSPIEDDLVEITFLWR